MHINPNPCGKMPGKVLSAWCEPWLVAERRKPIHIDACICLTEYDTLIKMTTFNNGSLGSCNDEERSEMRKVMRFA